MRQSFRLYRNWPTAVTDKWRLRGQLRLYRLREQAGGAALLATNWADTRILNELWSTDPYLAHVPHPDSVRVVVDVGANRGYFAVQAALRYSGATVVAFEPEPRNLRLLRANVALNGANVDVRPQALVPDDRAEVLLYEAVHPGFHTTLDPDAAAGLGIDGWRFTGEHLAVPAVNAERGLAEIVASAGPIDVLKIDTEGTELALLDALSDDMLGKINYVTAEILTPPTDALRRRFEAAGFQVRAEPPYLELTRP